MLQLGIPNRICIFVYNLTIKRKIFFRINGENKGPHILAKGLPQGCILRPILYMIYTIHIHKVIDPGCKILEYADDIALSITSDDMEEGVQILQHSLNSINSFLKNLGLSISPTKSKLIIFPIPIQNLPDNIHIQLDGHLIEPLESAVFLGITFHCSLSWNLNLKRLIDRGTQVLHHLKCLSGTWWRSHPRLLLILYRALARSTFDYDCHALSSGSA